MRAFIMSKETNRHLMYLLKRDMINENFNYFRNRIGDIIQNRDVISPEVCAELIITISNIYLTNIYEYVINNDTNMFIRDVINDVFPYRLNVNRNFYNDLMVNLYSPFIDRNIDEIEFDLNTTIHNYMISTYMNSLNEYKEAVINSYNRFRFEIPYNQINFLRLEVSPKLDPILFYQDPTHVESLCTV